MSMRMQAAINQLQSKVEELAIPMDHAAMYNRFSEMAARIEELEHRMSPKTINEIMQKRISEIIELENRVIEIENRLTKLEAKRKPGRPRKDER